MNPFSIKRILRAPGKQIVSLLVCTFLAVTSCYLFSYRVEQARSLAEAYESAGVLCVVTDITGTQSDHLRMGYGAVSAVTDRTFYRLPDYVKEPRMTKELLFNESVPIIAVSCPACADELDPTRGGGVTLFREDFFDSDEMICLVSEEAYLSLADGIVSGGVRDPRADQQFVETVTEQVELVPAGYYKGVGEKIFIPFETGMQLCNTISDGGRVDSLSFLAKDNTKLDELKDVASDVFGTVDPYAETGTRSFALTVHDENLKTTVAAIESNIRRTNWLIPITLALAITAGLLLGFIATRNESNTYALMRSVGMTKRKLFFAALLEQLLLPLVACAVMGAVFRAPLGALAVFLLYALGCTAAVLRAVSVSPTKLLREQE